MKREELLDAIERKVRLYAEWGSYEVPGAIGGALGSMMGPVTKPGTMEFRRPYRGRGGPAKEALELLQKLRADLERPWWRRLLGL